MNPVASLARAAAKTRWGELPEPVMAQASDLFLDTLAVIAVGLTHPDYAPFARHYSRASGPATIPGIRHGVPASDAAMVNGGATTVYQLQDGHRMARGHPASHLVPALLAVAETDRLSSAAMLSAFVAGYEAGTRIGIAMGGLNPALHDTGTWSSIGTAVAVTHLLTGGDPEALAAAIEGAAAVAPMPFRGTAPAGASIHHLYVGLGATTAMRTGRAVSAGLRPLSGTLQSFFGPRAAAAWDPQRLIEGIDDSDRWACHEMMNAYFKVHPTCAHLHGINDAVATLINEHALAAADVARMDVATYAAALEYDNPDPANDLAARFSIPGSVAIALCHGELTIDTLTSAALQGSAVQDLMQRIHVSHDPKLDQFYPQGRPCELRVTCHDGRQLTAAVIHPRGDSTNPLPRDARRTKAASLLAARFGPAVANEIGATWDAVIAGAPLAAVVQALRCAAVQ